MYLAIGSVPMITHAQALHGHAPDEEIIVIGKYRQFKDPVASCPVAGIEHAAATIIR
jgi:hypothetical protein